MGRKGQVVKTYGRHRQRVVVDEWKPKPEKQASVFSVSGSSDHLFSSSSGSVSDIWDRVNNSTSSFSKIALGNGKENQDTGRKTRSSRQLELSSDQESSFGVTNRRAKRQALKEIRNKEIAGKELDKRLNRKKKNIIVNNIKTTANNTSHSSETLPENPRKGSVINFSEFEDYSLIISDSHSVLSEDEHILGSRGQQKRIHSTPASHKKRHKKSKCNSSIDTSTPFCAKQIHRVCLEKLQDSNLSQIDLCESQSVFDHQSQKSSSKQNHRVCLEKLQDSNLSQIDLCESQSVFDHQSHKSHSKQNEECEIRDKLSLCSASLEQLCQSYSVSLQDSPGISLRNGKSFHYSYSKQNSISSNKSNAFLCSRPKRIQVTNCAVELNPLRQSLLQAHVDKYSNKSNLHISLTPAQRNRSSHCVFDASDSLFDSCPNSLNQKSVRGTYQQDQSDCFERHGNYSADQNLVDLESACEVGNKPTLMLETDSESSDSDCESSESDNESGKSLSICLEECEEEESLLEPGELKLINYNPTASAHRFANPEELNFSNTCYSLTKDGLTNDWSTEEITDQLANVSIDEKCGESEPSLYYTANSRTGNVSDLEDGELVYSFQQVNLNTTPQQNDRSARNLRSKKSNNVECLQKSFAEMLTPRKKSILEKSLSSESKILLQCEQIDYISFSQCFTQQVLEKCVKIGEGVYGEVFRPQNSNPVAFKIIPIEGDFPVNDEPQKTFDEILPEIIISRELSSLRDKEENITDNFVAVNRVCCVQGCYPKLLLDQWDEYDRKRGSENDRPDVFGESQLYIVFEFADGGTDLESFAFKNIAEVKSVFLQVAYSLAVAEIELEFEHRDLHWGNVLVRRSKEETVSYTIQGRNHEISAHGVHISIIDFTLSRLTKDGCTVFCDLSTDDTLFEGKGDYQFDIYRMMKEQNGNKWEPFTPYTNVLWLHYLLDKLMVKKACKVRSKVHKDLQRELRLVKKSLLDYQSAYDLITHCDFFS